MRVARWTGRQGRHERQTTAQQRDGFGECVTADSVFTRQRQVAPGPLGVASALKMQGELRRHIRHALAEAGLEAFGDPPMHPDLACAAIRAYSTF